MSNGIRQTSAELLISMQGADYQRRKEKLLKEQTIDFLESASRLPINKDNDTGSLMDGVVRVVQGLEPKPYYVSRNGNKFTSFTCGTGGVDSNGHKTCKHIKKSQASHTTSSSLSSSSSSRSRSLIPSSRSPTKIKKSQASSATSLSSSSDQQDPKVVSPSTMSMKRTGTKKNNTNPPKKRKFLSHFLSKVQQSGF